MTAQPRAAQSRQTLADFISVPDVYPVGRLDFDSEGLMLLTDDGALQHRLSDPKFEHARTYWVQVEGLVTPAALERLVQGVSIQIHGTAFQTRPCQAEPMGEPALPPRHPPIRFRQNIPTSWMALTITEGRNRQVRRMTAAIGFPTLRLIRVGMGALRLHQLGPGAWRDLEADERQALLRIRRPSTNRPSS